MQGLKSFERKVKTSIPQAVRRAVRAELAKQADRMVATMKQLAPPFLKDGIGWTWGDAPEGTMVLGTAGEQTDLRITFYSRAFTTAYPSGKGFPAVSAWFEFGTAERVQKTTGRAAGRITAQPFFYPGFRLWKKPAGSALKRAMRRGMKEGAR